MSQDDTTPLAAPAESFSGGLLLIDAEGRILEAPRFFKTILSTESRQNKDLSIYHLFDENHPPYLTFERVIRRKGGPLEFFVSVVDENNMLPQGFRYWSISQPPAKTETPSKQMPMAFYIVDESVILQSQEWHRRRIRREMLNHARIALSQHIRSRLTSIKALAEVLRDNPSVAAESGKRMLKSVDEMLFALEDIVDVTMVHDDIDDPKVRLDTLPKLISAWGSGIREVKAYGHELRPDITVPTDYLERVIQPLIQNAIEADGNIEVNIRELGNGFARFDIRDRGAGMSEYVREHAEDPFFTTKPGHLGMGLAHAWEVLKEIGGQWRIESKQGRGTRITVMLPVDD